jgi:hypothetical protein
MERNVVYFPLWWLFPELHIYVHIISPRAISELGEMIEKAKADMI